jgi:hypothetical protein
MQHSNHLFSGLARLEFHHHIIRFWIDMLMANCVGDNFPVDHDVDRNPSGPSLTTFSTSTLLPSVGWSRTVINGPPVTASSGVSVPIWAGGGGLNRWQPASRTAVVSRRIKNF